MARKAAEGIRIADFSWVAAGPIATKYLGVMGAEVIKIESLARRDEPRNSPAEIRPGFSTINYNKRSCTLNLSTPRGIELAKEIVRRSDVVIENYATDVMDRIGLGYEALRKIKPDIIMAASASLGHTGPYKDHIAYGLLVTTYSGIDSITGYEGGPPRGLGAPWGDPLTGIHLTLSILAALHHRERTGQGQYIDFSMAEVVCAQMPEAFLDYTLHGKEWGARGNMEEGAAPHNCYPCRGEDKWVAIAVTTEEQWQGFGRAIGSPAWCREERFADGYRRFQHRDELDKLVAVWTRQYTHYEVMARLQAECVPAGPSLDAKELVEDPHLQERGFFAMIEHGAGPLALTGMPWQIQPNPEGYHYTLAPLLGADNDYVFGEILGLSKEDIAELTAQKVIY